MTAKKLNKMDFLAVDESLSGEEIAARGKLPEISLHHLLPLPPSSPAADNAPEEPEES